MSTDDTPFTDADLTLLRRPLHGWFTTADGATPPQPRPVWFELADDGTIRLFSAADALKVRRLRRDPRASLVVAAPVEEREHWVAVTGHVTIDDDDAAAHALAARLAPRYWDMTDPVRQADLAAQADEQQVLLVLHPEKVRRYAY